MSLSLSTSVPGAETVDTDKRGKTARLLVSISLLASKNSAQSISQLLRSEGCSNWFIRTDFNMCLNFALSGLVLLLPLQRTTEKRFSNLASDDG